MNYFSNIDKELINKDFSIVGQQQSCFGMRLT